MSSDVRKLLASARASRRIASPYASYSLAGALFCNACNNQPIKSDTLWETHTKTPEHKANAAKRPPKSAKRPAEDDVQPEKRQKVSRKDGANVALPAGFFDDDVEAVEPIVEDVMEKPKTVPAPTALPSDFFAEKSTPANAPNLDDEWEAFQADIAAAPPSPSPPPQTVTNDAYTISAPAISTADLASLEERATKPEDIILGDIEDAQDAMADFFEEQVGLEEKVARLKRRREEVRERAKRATGMEEGTRKMSMQETQEDEEEEEETEDEMDDLDMFMR